MRSCRKQYEPLLKSSLKKRLWHSYFLVNFAKYLRAPFLRNTSQQLPLSLQSRLRLPWWCRNQNRHSFLSQCKPWYLRSWILALKVSNKQETLRVVTITIICSTITSLWKFQYFLWPICNQVWHLWWSFYCKNSKLLSIFTKSYIVDARLGSEYASVFTWRPFKSFISLKFLRIRPLKHVTSLKYFTSLNSSSMLFKDIINKPLKLFCWKTPISQWKQTMIK